MGVYRMDKHYDNLLLAFEEAVGGFGSCDIVS